jgi:hypothetical protein
MLLNKIGKLKVEIVYLIFPVVPSVIPKLFLHLVYGASKWNNQRQSVNVMVGWKIGFIFSHLLKVC